VGGRVVSILALSLPPGRGAAWSAQVSDRFGLSLRLLCRALGAPVPSLEVVEEGEEVLLIVAGTRHAVYGGTTAEEIARRLADRLCLLAWPAVLAPALAARGVGETGWLRHAAWRGLTVDALARLAEGGADDETIAWRLADRHPPVVTLRAGAAAIGALGDETLRERAAQDAAAWCGLPVPKPPPPLHDAALGPDEAAVVLGALPLPSFAWDAQGGWRSSLAQALRAAAPALIDPALALALLTDEARVPRRHAAAALARTGAVSIARRMVEAAADPIAIIDLGAIVNAAAGIAPA
jgi:hypothetical protein